MRDHLRLPMVELFSRVDAETEAFAAATGLRCPDGCGACCDSPSVHATAVELEPLAQALVAEGRAEAALEQAAARGPGVCVFYESHGPGRGRCASYELRPMSCRLFGFAAVRDKHARPELASCKVHKATQPEVVARANELVRSGAPVALMSAWQQQAVELGTSATSALVPINQAIREALERALFAASLSAAEAGTASLFAASLSAAEAGAASLSAASLSAAEAGAAEAGTGSLSAASLSAAEAGTASLFAASLSAAEAGAAEAGATEPA